MLFPIVPLSLSHPQSRARLALPPFAMANAPTAHGVCTPRPLALSAAAVVERPENPTAKLLIGATVTLGYEFALGHYLEFIKIMKQTNPNESYAVLTRRIVQSKGIAGIWDGFFPWGAIQGLAKGSVFSWAHALTKQSLQPYVVDGTLGQSTAEVLAGGIGGGFQGLALSPTLLLKTRVMTDAVFRERMTPLETSMKSLQVGMKVINNEGVSALMKGSMVFSLKRVADWSTRFLFSVMAENYLYKRENPDIVLNNQQKITASLIGGGVSALLTLPIDVMVAQIQQASKAGAQVSVVDTFRAEYKRGGMKQLAGFATTGFLVRLAHVSFTTMIMKTATSIVYEAYVDRQEA